MSNPYKRRRVNKLRRNRKRAQRRNDRLVQLVINQRWNLTDALCCPGIDK